VPRRKDRPQLPERERREPLTRALPQRWVSWRIPVLIVLVTSAAFLPALQNQFLRWDDHKNFLGNPHYRGLGWMHLRWMWTTHLGHYIPLTWMTLGLDYVLWGMNPLGYHLTNLLLHAANAVLFYFVAFRILGLGLPDPGDRRQADLVLSAGFAALVFAIHPLRVESVAWVTERRDVLSGLFYLSAILIYLRTCERGERGRGWYWAAVGSFACALLSKSMVVNLPIVLLILDVYPLRRLGGAIGWWSEPARRVYVEKIPFVLLATAAAAIAVMAQLSVHAAASLAQLSVPGRVAVSAYGLSFYLWKMVVPLNLSPLYPLSPIVNPWAMPFVLSYTMVLAITAIALALRRRVPGLPAAWSAYVVVLLPVLGIFQSGPQIAADRYTYLASLGWAILAGACLLFCWRISRTSTTGTPTTLPIAGVAICVVAGLGVLTWNQVHIWHDSERLWTYTVAIHPNSSLAQFSLGIVLSAQGKPTEAIEHFQKGLQLRPDEPSAHTNLGVALIQQGKLADAIEHFRQAVRIYPDDALAHTNWGSALIDLGKPSEAIEHFQQALRIHPDDALAHTNWGSALIDLGKPSEAIEHYSKALRITPGLAEAQNGLGQALAQEQRLKGENRNSLERRD